MVGFENHIRYNFHITDSEYAWRPKILVGYVPNSDRIALTILYCIVVWKFREKLFVSFIFKVIFRDN